jgi:DNA (cytosine-5)-methyltransferase 1
MKDFTYIDLFAGAGGLTIGFGRNNYHLVLANDIAKPALETLKKNLNKTHPKSSQDCVILGDIMELYHHLGTDEVEHDFQGHMVIQTNKEVELKRKTNSVKDNEEIYSTISQIEEIDVLVGGPPCQGFYDWSC